MWYAGSLTRSGQGFSGGGDSCCEIVRSGLCDARVSSKLLAVNSVLLS